MFVILHYQEGNEMVFNLTSEKSSFEMSINSTFRDNSILVGDANANFTPRTIWSIVLLLNLAVFIGTKYALLVSDSNLHSDNCV